MSDAKIRLKHLLDLAVSPAPEDRSRLVGELTALLLDWPEEYALATRAPFDRLLEKVCGDVDAPSRALLAGRFAAQPDAPIGLLNRLFFDAPDEVKPAILRRNALAHDDGYAGGAVAPCNEAALIQAMRDGDSDLVAAFACALGVDAALASRILAEPSGKALAAACKGAHLKRTTFSALALLFAPNMMEKERRLGAYDAVPQDGAESLTAFWRRHPAMPEAVEEHSRAA